MKRAHTRTTSHQVPPLAGMKSAAELQEQIRCRAYQLYEEHGRNDGHELGDWLRAEAEVARQKEKTVTP
jgi:hypothetical protein